MFRALFSENHSLGPADDHGVAALGAPGPLRERVLAHVRGEPIHDPSLNRRQRRRSLLGPAVALVAGIAIGSLSALALSSDHATTPAGARTGAAPQATLRQEGARAELLVRGMPEPPAGEVYEMWLVHGKGAPRATDALFTVTKAGSANVDVPGGLRGGVREVLVSNEPLGGSEHPTGQVLMRIKAPGST